METELCAVECMMEDRIADMHAKCSHAQQETARVKAAYEDELSAVGCMYETQLSLAEDRISKLGRGTR